jgi:hypothetical protein
MTLTFTLGWWMVPLAFTALALVTSLALGDDRGDLGSGIATMMRLGLAVIVSLIAWLIWAVLT